MGGSIPDGFVIWESGKSKIPRIGIIFPSFAKIFFPYLAQLFGLRRFWLRPVLGFFDRRLDRGRGFCFFLHGRLD